MTSCKAQRRHGRPQEGGLPRRLSPTTTSIAACSPHAQHSAHRDLASLQCSLQHHKPCDLAHHASANVLTPVRRLYSCVRASRLLGRSHNAVGLPLRSALKRAHLCGGQACSCVRPAIDHAAYPATAAAWRRLVATQCGRPRPRGSTGRCGGAARAGLSVGREHEDAGHLHGAGRRDVVPSSA